MKNIGKTDENYNDLLKELKEDCSTKYIKNGEIIKVFDIGQATIDDFETFNEENVSYDKLKEIIEYCKSTFKYMSEAEFRNNLNRDKLCDDVRKVIETSKNNIGIIARQAGLSPSLLSHIKNHQYKGVPQRLNFKKICKGFNLKESDYIEALRCIMPKSEENELKEQSNIINNSIDVELKDSDELIKDDIISRSTCFIFDSSLIGKETYHKLLVLLESLDTMIIGNVDFDLEITIKMK